MAIKRKTCKHCHMKILADVKICPYCGKKQGGKFTKLIIVLVLIFSVVGGLCWYFRKDLKNILVNNIVDFAHIGDTDDDKLSVEIEEGSLRVGQNANIDGFHIKMTKAIVSQGNGKTFTTESDKCILEMIFEIDNQSVKDIYISPDSFEGYCDEYSVDDKSLVVGKLPETEGMDTLSGDIASGKKIKGVIAYEIPKDFSKFELYFYNSNLSINKVLFTVTKDDVDF